jgi:hypothetical protein
MKAPSSRTLLLSAIAAIGFAATGAAAQQTDAARTDALLTRVQIAEEAAARGEKNAAREVVRVHLELAELRSADHFQSAEHLRNAALYMSPTNLAQAAEIMADAAQRYLVADDLIAAADAFLDAATMIVQSGGERGITAASFIRAQLWINYARSVADSPQLSSAEKERILRRTGPSEGHFAG